MMFKLLVIVAAAVLPVGEAEACSPPPDWVKRVKPSQEAIDNGALKTFRIATYVAQVTLVRKPRLRLRADKTDPPPGVLRVEAAIKGKPPRYLKAYPDPCDLYFQRVGERVVVAVMGRLLFPVILDEKAIASLKRRQIGNWSNVRNGSKADLGGQSPE